MSKSIVLNFEGGASRFAFSKLDRKKLYGYRRRISLDANGEPCKKASLTEDGRFVLQSGMTAQGYFTSDDTWIANKDLIGLVDGKAVDKVASTLGVAQLAQPCTAQELLDHQLTTVYMLTPDEIDDALSTELHKGTIFKFSLNYRADYHAETGFLVHNDAGVFVLVGIAARPKWIGPDRPNAELEATDEPLDDELDFEMF